MNEVWERDLACYIKKLEEDNEMLREFADEVRSTVFDFDGANPDKSDKDNVNHIRALIQANEHILKGD